MADSPVAHLEILTCIVARELAAYPQTQLLYTDEDKIDEQGRRYDPYFKPDWNPELLLGQNYISHLGVYRAARVREATDPAGSMKSYRDLLARQPTFAEAHFRLARRLTCRKEVYAEHRTFKPLGSTA